MEIVMMKLKTDFNSLPNFSKIYEFIDSVKKYIFLGYFEPITMDLKSYRNEKIKQIKELFHDYIDKNNADSFINKLDELENDLEKDLAYFIKSDPAAESKEEIVFTYPGYLAIIYYRIAHILYDLNILYIPRIITEKAHSLTGIDIHPGAKIGVPFFIDHGTGIVIGQTSVIGNYVKMYHGVTLGALSLKGGHALYGIKRHPTIKDYVTIYSGASILGGKTVIGERVTIGSNVFIVDSVVDDTSVIYTDKGNKKIKKK